MTWSSRCATTPTRACRPTSRGCIGRCQTRPASTPTTPSRPPTPNSLSGSTDWPAPSSRERTMTDQSVEPAVLNIDHHHALRTAATHLADRFAGMYDAGTVQRLLHSCYEEVAVAATVPTYL